MTIFELINYLNNLAPPGIAWEKDNPGLQIGNTSNKINNIVLAIDFDEDVLNFNIKKKANLIITHHPFLFKPLKSIDLSTEKGKLISQLIKNNVSLFSVHTNLDFYHKGVSYSLAKRLGLKNLAFLRNIEAKQYKLVTFLPADSVDKFIKHMSNKGAGVIGDYSYCSFGTPGKGTFLGGKNTNPFIGKKGKVESVDEVRIEMVFNCWDKESIINGIKEIHPYEEPAFDIYPLLNEHRNYGFGYYGFLEQELDEKQFLNLVSNKLDLNFCRWSKGKTGRIRRVAVCGGSGRELIADAIKMKCDAIVTADIDYHSFLEYYDKIMVIDAGHFYTEAPVLDLLENEIKDFMVLNKNNKTKIYKFYPNNDKIKIYNKRSIN